MASRAERTLVGDWLWTVDRLLIAGLSALMISGLVFLVGGGPAGRGAARVADLPLRQSTGALPRARHPDDGCRLLPVAAPRPPAGAAGLCGQRLALHPSDQLRARDQGRASLDHAGQPRHPAL